MRIRPSPLAVAVALCFFSLSSLAADLKPDELLKQAGFAQVLSGLRVTGIEARLAK